MLETESTPEPTLQQEALSIRTSPSGLRQLPSDSGDTPPNAQQSTAPKLLPDVKKLSVDFQSTTHSDGSQTANYQLVDTSKDSDIPVSSPQTDTNPSEGAFEPPASLGQQLLADHEHSVQSNFSADVVVTATATEKVENDPSLTFDAYMKLRADESSPTVSGNNSELAQPALIDNTEQSMSASFILPYQSYGQKEEEIPEPAVVDPSLEAPEFQSENASQHVEQITQVLGYDQFKMTKAQREKFRQYLVAFSEHYKVMSNYQATVGLHYNVNMIDTVFGLIHDKLPNLDVVLSLLVILSRHSKPNGPDGGKEPRLLKIIKVMDAKISNIDIVREGAKSMINYAEVNAQFINDNNGFETLSNAMSRYASNEGILSAFMLLFRNMCVTELCRKAILDRFGFIITNCIGLNHKDKSIAENGCFVLGNLSLLKEAGPYLASSGAIQTVRSIMQTYADEERVQDAACWFLLVACSESTLLSSIVKAGMEEVIIAAHRKFHTNSSVKSNTEQLIHKIREAINATSPEAVAAKYANTSSIEGYLIMQGGFFNRLSKKWFIVQPYRIIYCSNENDPEISGEIKMKEIVMISVDPEDKSKLCITGRKSITIKTTDGSPILPWFKAIFKFWKIALDPVQESPILSQIAAASGNGGAFALPEYIYPEDAFKTCLQHVSHDIFANPFYCAYQFKSQKDHPNVDLKDWFLVKTAKSVTDQFINDKLQNYKCSGRDAYDAVKAREELTEYVDDNLVDLLKKFDESPPVDDAPLVSTRYEYSAKQGIRPTMEDRHVHLPYVDALIGRDKKDEPASFYAVYDGHGGTHVAHFVETHLLMNIMKHQNFEEDTKKAIEESFMRTQEDLKTMTDRLYWNNSAGSTAVTVLIKGKKMYASWAGDSLATLYLKDDQYRELVDPHKPGKDSEKARIEKLGGFVNDEMGVPRVNGAVAVSRAFGNIRHRVIIPEPDLLEIDLTGDEEFIIVACDGLWDVMTSKEVRTFVKKYMNKNGKRTKGISTALVDEALRRGSTDNVSVVFVEFKDWKAPKRQ